MGKRTDNIKKILEQVSGGSFLLSSLASKIQYLPIARLIAPFLNLMSLTLSLFAYSLWYVASFFYPNHYPKNDGWYAFSSFKKQHSYAAIIGIGAAIISIAAIAIPVLALPASWLFFVSNVLWAIGEYHKLKSPILDGVYSESRQKSYVSYALSITSIGLITALATTLVFIFPLQMIPILAVSSIASIAFSFLALEYWLDFNFNEHKESTIALTSYNKMSPEFRPNTSPVQSATRAPSSSTETPSSSTETPSSSTETPSSSTETPSSSTETPSSSTETKKEDSPHLPSILLV